MLPEPAIMSSEEELNFLKSTFVNTNEKILQRVLSNAELFQKIIGNPFDSIRLIYDNLRIDNGNVNLLMKKILVTLSKKSDAKVILCILNELINDTINNNDYKYEVMLSPFSIAIQNLQVNYRASYLNLNESLDCSLAYFKRITTAHYSGLEGSELDVYIQSSETQRFYQLSETYLEFLKSICNNKQFMSDTIFSQTIVNHILKFYHVSLIKLGFYSDRVVAQDCKKCVLKAFSLIEMNTNCMYVFVSELLATAAADEAVGIKMYESALCLMFHLFIDEQVTKYPRIYSDEFNLNFVIQAVWHCLNECQDSHIIRICIALLKKFTVEKIKYKSSLHLNLLKALTVSMISNFNQEIRGSLFSIFISIFKALESKGRYDILQQMLKLTSHPGVKGQLVLLLKEEILTAISSDKTYSFGDSGKLDDLEEQRQFFTGVSAYKILSHLFELPDKNETDVVHESDWLLAALNFLYVIRQRDRHQKMIGLDVLLDDIHVEFLNPLNEALNLAQVHYEKERNGLAASVGKELLNSEDEVADSSACDVLLGPAASFMATEEKVSLVEKALLLIDMLRNGIARINSL